MKCPKCSHDLAKENYNEIEVDQCTNCQGMWFEYDELDQLEDKKFDQDQDKNTLITNLKHDDAKCPVCNGNMQKFNYRWENLEIEMCPNKHGFWLDKGEEKRVMQLMEQYKNNLNRSQLAESEWKSTLRNLNSSSFMSKFFDLFK